MWLKNSNRKSIEGGKDKEGNTIYICRNRVNGNEWVSGKIHFNTCYIGYGGKEYFYSDYFTLKQFDS